MGLCCCCIGSAGPMRKGCAYRPFPLLRKETIAEGSEFPVRKLTFALAEPDAELGFGQPTTHVKIRGPGAIIRGRTYSISHSAPGEFSITVKVRTNGWVSSYLDSLKIGDFAFFAATQTKTMALASGPVGFVAYGVGAAELIHTIPSLLVGASEESPVVLVLANRRAEDVIYAAEFAALEATFGNRFRCYHVLSRDEGPSLESSLHGTAGHTGRVLYERRVDAKLLADVFGQWASREGHPPTFMVVGTRDMIRTTHAELAGLGLGCRLLGRPRLSQLLNSRPPQHP